MAVTWGDISAIAPDLVDPVVPTATQAVILLDVAATLSNPGAWPSADVYARAQVYLAAHLGTLVKRGSSGAGGVVQSETVGPLSRTYAVGQILDALDVTLWGVQFKRLRRSSLNRAGRVS